MPIHSSDLLVSDLAALFTIFEKHLYDLDKEEANEAQFINDVVEDYIKFLHQNGAIIPKKWRIYVVDELKHQVKQMMVKKTYGCLTVEEFLKKEPNISVKKRQTKKKYQKIL